MLSQGSINEPITDQVSAANDIIADSIDEGEQSINISIEDEMDVEQSVASMPASVPEYKVIG